MKDNTISATQYKGTALEKSVTLTVEETLQDKLEKGLIDEDLFCKSMIELDILKAGKRAVIGEIRERSGGRYKKTVNGWEKVTEEDKEYEIGKTESGKQVFKNKPAKNYENFSAKDHENAYKLHSELEEKHNKRIEELKKHSLPSKEAIEEHKQAAHYHKKYAEQHKETKENFKNKNHIKNSGEDNDSDNNHNDTGA